MTTMNNRYDFVFFFDVENGNPMATRMRATCRAWTRKPIRGWCRTSA